MTRNLKENAMPSFLVRGLLPFLISVAYIAHPCVARAQAAETLPNTSPLDWTEEDLSGRLMDGAHQFVERKIEEAIKKRHQLWERNATARVIQSDEANPELLRRIIGAIDPLLADSRPDLFQKM